MSQTIDQRNQPRGQGDATPADGRAAASAPPPADSAAFATVYNDVRRPSHPFLRPPVEADEIGRLGSYRVLRLLGQGGMGFVFHAEDAALRRPVALKVMRPELDQDEDGLERFLREARLMASIKHDHLVTVYQVGQEGRLPYLAMELLQGESLDHWMKQSRKVSVSDVLRLSREIVSGLAVIHRHGLIHRDVKPANIWLEKPGGRVKILDFGLARVAKDEARLTQPGMVLGTPAFMAPEQARGETVDARGDLFSVGCILYELASGTRPFEAPTTMAALTALAVKDPQPLHELRSSLPRDLSDLIMQLLAKDPARRPESAQVVLARLRKIEARLAARPASVSASATRREPPPRPKTRTRMKKAKPTDRPWLTKALVIGLPLLAVLTIGSALLVPAVFGRPNPAASRPPSSAFAAPSAVFVTSWTPIDDQNPISAPPPPPGAPPPPPGAPPPPFAGVRVHDQPSPHGIFMHPPMLPNGGAASLSYKLGKQYGVFNADISLNDGPPEADTPLTFSVFGDGRLLWQSHPVRRQADADRCAVSVKGVDVLTLQVNCPGSPRGAHAVWVEPSVAP